MIRGTTKNAKRRIRQNRIRSRISGTSERPRLCVYRSNANMYAQIIDDTKGKTLATFSDKHLSAAEQKKPKMERASLVGKNIAAKAKELKISKVVFDRAGFQYTGRIKALADAAREGGLDF